MAQVKAHVKCKALKMDLMCYLSYSSKVAKKIMKNVIALMFLRNFQRFRHALNIMKMLSDVVRNL